MNPSHDRRPWHEGVTAYQWLVLVIASLGWVFDVFEGQIFVTSMEQVIPALVPKATDPGTIEFYKDVINGCFLLGGALGGVLFGIVSDRIGRVRTMVYTILVYSFFTCLSAVSREWWHMAAFRFLVALGVGGEWAVASSLVAEVFPQRARARSLGIFHASSVLGTYLAVAAGAFVVPLYGWRPVFLLGAVPALLTIWVRLSLREPVGWQQAKAQAAAIRHEPLGRITDLFRGRVLRNTLVGIGLGTIGLTTFWGTHIYGKNLFLRDAKARYTAHLPPSQHEQVVQAHNRELKHWEMAGMLLATTGGGLGLLAFGPIAERIGRRGAFLLFHLAGLVVALVTFQLAGLGVLTVALPIFGFFTLGMHAGYAIYFPELFPTRLRSTGAGVCFNLARLAVFPVLFVTGWLQRPLAKGGLELTREQSASLLSLLFLVGAVLLFFAVETKGQDLPE
ncbi:MAG: MFS transporter [Planctomycetia bacterium]|nr:MFS transporter [Planctomycetia bacterium]